MHFEERLKLQELNYLYALYIDRFQIDEWVNVFTPDATFDESEFGFGRHVGHEAICAYGRQLAKEMFFLVHLMANHTVMEMADGKRGLLTPRRQTDLPLCGLQPDQEGPRQGSVKCRSSP